MLKHSPGWGGARPRKRLPGYWEVEDPIVKRTGKKSAVHYYPKQEIVSLAANVEYEGVCVYSRNKACVSKAALLEYPEALLFLRDLFELWAQELPRKKESK